MEPAPLPPHERHWRHPSELAPTALHVESGGGSRALVVASGTTALLLAAVLVIALAPTRTSAPIAMSATTLPPATIQLRNTPAQVTVAPLATEPDVLTFQNMMRPEHGVALAGAPNAISAAPVGDADDFALAGGLPAESDRVIVLTTSYAYDMKWGDIDHISAPDGSIVMTRDGRLVATFVSGELRLLVN